MKKHTPSVFSSDDLINLTRAILASRFPDDTQSARYGQLAFVHLMAAELMCGNQPTLATLAAIADGQIMDIDSMAKILTSRGVISEVVFPGANNGASAVAAAYLIVDDPVEALQQAHIALTGAGIVL
jgi:hypothetical protein